MADVVVEAATFADQTRGMRAVVFVTSLIGYMVLINGDSDLDYVKTTDGGKTWGAAVDLFTGSVDEYDVWYDQWTPGDTGRLIHVWFVENGTDDVSYLTINTTNGALSAVVDVFAGGSTAKGRGTFVTGCKTRSGSLLCGFNIDAFAETGLYRSTDNGVTWSARTQPLEANLDQYMLFPANAADPADAWLLYDDDSATQLTVKTYDDSANSFSESSGITFDNNATNVTGPYGFSGAIRHQGGDLIFALFNAYDAAGEDFLCYQWDGTTLTALTALTTDKDDMYFPSVFLNQDRPDDIYIGYIGKSDGLEALSTGAKAYYAKSTDRGKTWTMDITYMEAAATDVLHTWAPLNGERFLLVWMDVSALSLNTNADKSVEFGFTPVENYRSLRATGQNAGIMSIAR
jgi:hypothetical protein